MVLTIILDFAEFRLNILPKTTQLKLVIALLRPDKP